MPASGISPMPARILEPLYEPEAEPAFRKSFSSVSVGSPIKYFLLGDEGQSKRAQEAAQAQCIAAAVSSIKEDDVLAKFVAPLAAASPVLVTGSSGYLGSALVEVLQAHGIPCMGFDLVGGKSATTQLGCISDRAALRYAAAGCRTVIHTAALHAPNADFYSDEDYQRVNVQGTQNVLAVARELGMKGMVFSSTTSLMNTEGVKRRSKSETVVQEASVDYGTPRNIYGVTKRAAELLCLGQQEVNVAVLRCSRFFAEDAYDTGAAQAERTLQGSNGNVKANEMLCGARTSLEDLLVAHLVALVRVCEAKKSEELGWAARHFCGRQPCGQKLMGPLVVSAVSPLLDNGGTDVSVAKHSAMYAALGWSAPEHPGRILDSRATWEQLSWTPRWSFQRLLADFKVEGSAAVVQDGLY